MWLVEKLDGVRHKREGLGCHSGSADAAVAAGFAGDQECCHRAVVPPLQQWAVFLHGPSLLRKTVGSDLGTDDCTLCSWYGVGSLDYEVTAADFDSRFLPEHLPSDVT